MRRRATPHAAASVLLCLGLVLAAGPTYAGQHRSPNSTSYAFKASGFGTRLVGGQVPGGSSTTGYQAIGCTNQAGRARSATVAGATLPGLGTATGIRTRVWTTRRHGVVASHSRHSIAEVVLARSGLGKLSLAAISSTATAYHDARGFHATTTTKVGGLRFTPPVGPAQAFPLPTPDQPVTIPGLATIYAGRHTTHRFAASSSAGAFALRVEVIPTGSSLRLAHSHAELGGGLTGGVLRGSAAGTHVITAGGGVGASGPTPLSLMPCQGTHGRTRQKSLASVNLGGQFVVKGASSLVRGAQGDRRAHGTSRSEVARVDLGGGQLVIDGIVGKVSVARRGHHLKRSTSGTTLGRVTVAGEPQTFPRTGVLEIPGVAELERAVVQRTRRGVSVIGLRITLLDGSGAVVDLAEARLSIRRLPH
jgi:hypothetical protein